ncbi:YHS domain-containing (seleno)protein [Sneathiella limimaris]|uniref:YHS domain-containing (seleno)protein n=1 Tax=Sneathiella limimaris TaxID=1964213 RepID=UPI00146B6708|nr:YHS domain-containing (seleno)protein [Sneathiella limimaris]
MPLRLLILFVAMIFSTPVFAFDEINTGYFDDTALHGHDATGYFQAGRSTEGAEAFHFRYKNADWYFADKESRDLFALNPEQYAPQYGGYCSNQMSLGNIADIDPGVWLIHEKKLYFFGHQEGKDRWVRTGIAARIEDANRHWQDYLAKK